MCYSSVCLLYAAIAVTCICAAEEMKAQAACLLDFSRAIAITNVSTDSEAVSYVVQGDNILHLNEPQRLDKPGKFAGKLTDGRDAVLYVSELPLLHITTPLAILDEPKRRASLTMFEVGKVPRTFAMGIEKRGKSSLQFPKKSYGLELREALGSEESVDATFAGLRLDDDWILDALYNEPLRIRSVMAHELWVDSHNPYYQDQEPSAQSGALAVHCELFLNGRYKGVYSLSERIDRKLLQLRKPTDADSLRGSILKSIAYAEATSFNEYSPPTPGSKIYNGYEWVYPKKAISWSSFTPALKAGLPEGTGSLLERLFEQFEPGNYIDYYLFVQLGRMQDNLGKNVFYCRYDQDEPLFLVPWDLDAVFGNTYKGRKDKETDELRSSGLTLRLYKDSDDFYQRCRQRYATFRANQWEPAKIEARFDSLYQKLSTNYVYEREALLYRSRINSEADYAYLKKWLSDRYEFLDTFFKYGKASASKKPSVQWITNIYPNPSSVQLTVELDEALPLPQDIRIIGGTNEVVERVTTFNHTTSIRTDHLAAGWYYVLVGEQVLPFVVQ